MEKTEALKIYETYRELEYEGYSDELLWKSKEDAEKYITEENAKEDGNWRHKEHPLQFAEISVWVLIKN